jgi:hypothetical protein
MDKGLVLKANTCKKYIYTLKRSGEKKIVHSMQDVNSNKFVFNNNLNAAFLEELFEGDSIYAETVFEDFLKDLPAYWKRVEAAYASGNMPELRTSIHTCKTLFGYVGFTDIQQFCQDFENRCNDSTTGELSSSYHDLLRKKGDAQQVIENEFKRLKIFNGTR